MVLFVQLVLHLPSGVPIFLLIVLVAALGTALVNYFRRLRRRPARWGVCPNCRYDLLNLPDAIPESVLGFSIGPRRCPECGEPWPRVPDPTD